MWVCKIGWDDRQNGQGFAAQRRTSPAGRPTGPSHPRSSRRDGARDPKMNKPLFMSRLGFDELGCFLFRTQRRPRRSFCGGRRKAGGKPPGKCSAPAGPRLILIRVRQKCGFVGIGRKRLVRSGGCRIAGLWNLRCRTIQPIPIAHAPTSRVSPSPGSRTCWLARAAERDRPLTPPSQIRGETPISARCKVLGSFCLSLIGVPVGFFVALSHFLCGLSDPL